MLDAGEAPLISEPKIKFAVPFKVTHYPEYLDSHGRLDYGLLDCSNLLEMNERLRKLNEQGKLPTSIIKPGHFLASSKDSPSLS